MADDTVRSRVIAILAEQAVCDPATVRDEMTLEALGLDSVGLVEAVFAIEEAFQVAVPFESSAADAAASEWSTVGAVVAAVDALVTRGEG